MFEQEIKKIKNLSNSISLESKNELNESINNLLKIISDEKRIFFQYIEALEKINKIESVLGDQTPLILVYRRACIEYEFKNDLDSAEREFLKFLKLSDKLNVDEKHFLHRSKYYLIEIALKKVDELGFLDSEISINRAKVYLQELSELAKLRELDEFILSNLSYLKFRIDELNNEDRFRVISIHDRKQKFFSTFDEALKFSVLSRVVIDYSNKKVLVNGKEFFLSIRDIDYLTHISLGCTVDSINRYSEPINTIQQRISRLRRNKKLRGVNFIQKGVGHYGIDTKQNVSLIIADKDLATFEDSIEPLHDLLNKY